ncbi:hypothetical protein F4677DRAFT_44341 [Hypoxylon crocopeplum]|nr:hypothetical protein F4677DRAFT_44341 [Hypoxylon crocopeplum]
MPDRGAQTIPEPLEKDAKQVGRFQKLASAMHKDEDLAVLRRFGDLHMLQLLNLQAELDQMRSDFQNACRIDEPLYEATPYNYLAADPLEQGASKETDLTRRQKAELRKDLGSAIKIKLKEYNEALLIESQIRNLETPDQADVEYLRAWISPDIGGLDLNEADRSCWGADHKDDFVSLKNLESRQNKILTQVNFWFRIVLYKLWGYSRSSSNQTDTGIINFSADKQRVSKRIMQKRLAFSSRLIMALFGGIALIVPTVIMALFPYRNTCLITTSAFTVVFAFVLAVGARDSTGKDVLTATAAYTAVLVVFLGSSLESTS